MQSTFKLFKSTAVFCAVLLNLSTTLLNLRNVNRNISRMWNSPPRANSKLYIGGCPVRRRSYSGVHKALFWNKAKMQNFSHIMSDKFIEITGSFFPFRFCANFFSNLVGGRSVKSSDPELVVLGLCFPLCWLFFMFTNTFHFKSSIDANDLSMKRSSCLIFIIYLVEF